MKEHVMLFLADLSLHFAAITFEQNLETNFCTFVSVLQETVSKHTIVKTFQDNLVNHRG